jgi:predicted  nucleic acid-binding Zn-ribbon protein
MIERMLVLQDRDRKIKQLTKESEDVPARKKLIESRLNQTRQALQGVQDEQKKSIAAAKQVDLEIESLKLKILKLRDQQGQIKTNEAYKALEHEIQTVQRHISEFEDREITIVEETEVLREKAAGLEKKLKEEEKGVQGDSAVLDQRLQKILEEIEKLKADRSTLLTDVDPGWLSRYERTFKHVGDYALVPIENASCGGCHMKLPPQVIQNVKKSLDMVYCSFCGRILYWKP